MADKPQLPKGEGGGSISDAIQSMSDMVGVLSGQLVSLTSLQSDFSAFADLWLEDTQRITDFNKDFLNIQDELLDTNRLIAENTNKSAASLGSIDTTLKSIQEFIAPISAHFTELLEETPDRSPARAGGQELAPPAGSPPMAAPGPEKKADGSFATGLTGLFTGLAGAKATGAISGILGRLGLGLGVFGIGLGAVTGALLLGAKATESFGVGLRTISVGLEELNNIELTPEKFTDIGNAISAMANEIEISGALGLLITAKTNFEALAGGLERLSDTEFDAAKITLAGSTLNKFIQDAGSQWFDAATVGRLGNNLSTVANGLTSISSAATSVPADFITKMELIGNGLGEFIDGLGAQMLDAGTIDALGDNFDTVAKGVQTLTAVSPPGDFVKRMTDIGIGLSELINRTGSWTGNDQDVRTLKTVVGTLGDLVNGIDVISAVDTALFREKITDVGLGMGELLSAADWRTLASLNLQAIDDNLIPLAEGADRIAKVDGVNFLTASGYIGAGLTELLSSTDWKMLSSINLQGIDDNLIPLAEGADRIAAVDSLRFFAVSGNIGQAITRILGPLQNIAPRDINKLTLFSNNLDALKDGVVSLNEIDKETLGPVLELMQYASDLLSGSGLEKIGVAMSRIDQASTNISKLPSDDASYKGFDKFREKLQTLESLNIDKLSRLGVAVQQISTSAADLIGGDVEGRTQTRSLAAARATAEQIASVVNNVTADNSSATVQQNVINGGKGGGRSAVGAPFMSSRKNVYV